MELKAYLYEFGSLVDFLSPEKREVFRRINHEYLLMLNERKVEEMQAIIWDGIQANVNSVRKQFLKNQANGNRRNASSDFEIPIDVAMHLNAPVQKSGNGDYPVDTFKSPRVSSEAVVSKELVGQALRDVREALVGDKELGKWLLIAAFKQLDKAFHLDAQNYKAHFNYAWLCNFFFSNPVKAEQHFEQAVQHALEQDPYFTVFALRHLAETRRDLNKYDAAVQAAYEAYMLDRDQTPQIRFDLARYLTLAGEHQKAANYLEMLIKEYPEYYWQIRVEPDLVANSHIETLLDQHPANLNGKPVESVSNDCAAEEPDEISLAKMLEENRHVNGSDPIPVRSSDDSEIAETEDALPVDADANQHAFSEIESAGDATGKTTTAPENAAAEFESTDAENDELSDASPVAELDNETTEISADKPAETPEIRREDENAGPADAELSQLSISEKTAPPEPDEAEIDLPIDFSNIIRQHPIDMETDILNEPNAPGNASFIFAPATAFTTASPENIPEEAQVAGEGSSDLAAPADEIVEPDERLENKNTDIFQPAAEALDETDSLAAEDVSIESIDSDAEEADAIEIVADAGQPEVDPEVADLLSNIGKNLPEFPDEQDGIFPEENESPEVSDPSAADPEIVDLLSNVNKNLPELPDEQDDVFSEENELPDTAGELPDEYSENIAEESGGQAETPGEKSDNLPPETVDLLDKIERNSSALIDDGIKVDETTLTKLPSFHFTQESLDDESQNLLALLDFKEISAPQKNDTEFTFDENMPDGYEQAAEQIRQEMELALERCEKLGSFLIRRDLEKTVERIELIGETSIEKLRNIPEADWKKYVRSTCKQLRRQVDKFRNRHKFLSRLKRA